MAGVEPYWLEIVQRPLPISGLPAGLRGATLVQLSDLHVGPRVPDDYILETFERVRALRPDVVAYTGDFISYENGIVEHARSTYQDLPRGRVATVGVFGNHDYGPGWSHPEVAAQLADLFGGLASRSCGTMSSTWRACRSPDSMTYGRGSSTAREAWLTSIRARRHSRSATTRTRRTCPGWEGFRGWILSGHTHGGQCKAPFLPPPLLPVRNRRYTSGEFDLSGDRRMYISRGIGHVLRVRFNVRPEVTAFTLQSA